MATIQQRVDDLASQFAGQLAVSAVDLTTGERFDWNAEAVLPTASVIKVPILLTLLRQADTGQLDLGHRLQLSAEARIGGSGVFKLFEGGLQPTIRDTATVMIALSDNTATNMVLDVIGGLQPVNDAMAELGLDSCQMHNVIDFEAIGSDIRRLGESSAADLCRLMHLIATRRAFSEQVSVEAEDILATQQYLDQAARYVLTNPYARELGVTSPVVVACKTGFFTGTRVDAGIMRFEPGGGFAYALANDGSPDTSFLPEAEGAVLNGLVGRAMLEHWWPADAGPAPVTGPSYAAPFASSRSS